MENDPAGLFITHFFTLWVDHKEPSEYGAAEKPSSENGSVYSMCLAVIKIGTMRNVLNKKLNGKIQSIFFYLSLYMNWVKIVAVFGPNLGRGVIHSRDHLYMNLQFFEVKKPFR